MEVPSARLLCSNVLSSDDCDKTEFFRHAVFSYRDALKWPPEGWEAMACWHCRQMLSTATPPVCAPKYYDSEMNQWHVFGIFCSWPCAKAYVLEKNGFSSGEASLMLDVMARRLFGREGAPIRPAPPWHRLKLFGGDLSPAQFASEHEYDTVVLSPPLISHPEVYERVPVVCDRGWRVKGLRATEQQPPAGADARSPAAETSALYEAYLKERGSTTAMPAAASSSLEGNSSAEISKATAPPAQPKRRHAQQLPMEPSRGQTTLVAYASQASGEVPAAPRHP